MVKVSIIVPIYNTSKYLKKCIDSLLNQTLKDIEIILINDGSTDNSEDIVKLYKDKRIVYKSKKNEGIGKTRNLGITLAKGKYISFIDSDDYVTPDFCEKMYNKAIKDNCDIVICNYYENNNGIKKINFKPFKDSSLKENPGIINSINLGPCNKIYKKELFNNKDIRFEENLKYEDAPFVCKILYEAKRIGKLNNALTYYVIHSNSETTIRDERIFDILKVADIIINLFSMDDTMHNQMVDLLVMILTDYTIQQRYINIKDIRSRFIDQAFNCLDNLDPSWRKTPYLKKFSLFKRLIKSHKFLTKIYCDIYVFRHNN